jgi:hypothetical protein
MTMARPPKYATEEDKPVSVTLRLPRDLYNQAQHHAKVRQTTLTELVREGLQMRLETPTDPRDILATQDITVMQELEQMIDARVYAILAAQGVQASAPVQATPVQKVERKSKTKNYSNASTAMPEASQESPVDDFTPAPTPAPERVEPESVPQHTEGSQTRAYGEVPAAVLATLAHQHTATAAEIAKALGDDTKQGTKTVWQALQRLCKSGKVQKQGKQYQLMPR